MHPFIQKILMLRDQDLAKWGRCTAILCFAGAVILAGAAVMTCYYAKSKWEPNLWRAIEADHKQMQFLERKGYPMDSAESYNLNMQTHQSLSEVFSAMTWLLSSLSLIFILSGLYAWRACELARYKVQHQGEQEK